MWLVGRGGRPGAGKRRMTCPHAGIDSGGAKAAANLCKGTGPRRARQAHWQLSAGGAGWPGRALLACSSAGGTGVGPDRAEDSEEYLIGLSCEDWRAELALGGGLGSKLVDWARSDRQAD
jgi:hypothetical protein